MKMRKWIFAFIVFVICTGCGKNQNDRQNIIFDCSGYEKIDFESIEIPEGVEAFVFCAEEKILCSRADEKVYLYDKNGILNSEISSDSFYGNFCVEKDAVYAYDYKKSAIVQIVKDGEFLSNPVSIQNAISFRTIRNMIALDGKLYVLAIPFTSENAETFFDFGLEEFKDYGEVVYSINIENGQYQTLDLEHIAAEYASEDGRLFFYGWKEDKYYLYEYDTERDKITKKITSDEMKNLMSIVVEGGYLFGISSSEGLVAIDLETGEKADSIEKVYAMFGNDLQFYRGNLFVNNMVAGEIQRLFVIDTEGNLTITVSDEKKEADKNSLDPTPHPKREETIGVSVSGHINVRTDKIRQVSGMQTNIIFQSLDLEALISEMMAGNSDVDIYVLPHGWALTQRIRDLRLYEPLNNSEIISSYLEKCFDYIQTAATASNQDIWMVPLYESATGTWYVPENMEKFGISAEELGTLDNYIEVLKRLQGRMGQYNYYNNGATFFAHCDSRYDANYNNYETGEINFDTPLYRHIAELFWPGWDRYGSATANHPLFFKVQQHGEVMTEGETPDLNRDTVVFKTINMHEHLLWSRYIRMKENGEDIVEATRTALQGWRILPFPELQSDSEKETIAMTYAYVNPYSKQKEAAIEYLESILENQAEFVQMPLFFREDMEYYQPYYDTSMPAFQDIYEIFKNADVFYGYSWDLSDAYITDYQRELISFDEAIERRQKQAMTGLEE